MRSFLLVLLFSTAANAAAQSDYLPLEVGNEWTYYSLIDPPGEPYDTLAAGTFTIQSSIAIEGKTYFTFDHPEAFADTVRADESGRILTWMNGEEHLYFDLTAEDGAAYTFPGFDAGYPITVTVSRGRTVETRAGRFDDCIAFSFDIPQFIDDERSFFFAPGVGIVHTLGGMGEPRWLYSAKIGDRPIPSGAIVLEEPYVFSFQAFPNPFRSTAAISFVLEKEGRASIIVFDVAGREVARLGDRRLYAGPHRFNWPAQQYAAGVYVIVLDTEGRRAVRTVTHIR